MATSSDNKSTANGKSFKISKGQLNHLSLRPQIANELSENASEVQDVVNSTTIVGQIFKPSHNNINGISMVLDSAAGTSFDDFESYADSTALQAAWAASNSLATLNLVTVDGGDKSMKITGTVLNDEWVKTIAATDYTEFDFCFSWYQDHPYDDLKYEFFISDGTNTKRHQLVVDHENGWFTLILNEESFVEDGATTNIAAITKIGIKVVDKKISSAAYIDNIITTPPPGTVNAKLWDFGTTLPEDGVTSLDDATQYIELGDRGFNSGQVFASVPIFLHGGKRVYQIDHFVAGVAEEIPSNTLLNKNNYYGITLHYVDTDVNVWGNNTSLGIKNYTNGYAFSTPNTSTGISRLGAFSDLMFIVYSTQDVEIIKIFQKMITLDGSEATPGITSTLSMHIEDANINREETITNQVPVNPELTIGFDWRPKLIPKGGRIETHLNDDYRDDIFILELTIEFLHKQEPING